MTVRVTQTLNVPAINAQLHGRNGAIARDMLRRGLRVQATARRLASADTGRLRGSVEVATEPRIVFSVDTFGVVIGTTLVYAPWVIRGTGVYGPSGVPITPRSGTYLAFKSKTTGRTVLVKSVKGQPPHDFLQKALHIAARG